MHFQRQLRLRVLEALEDAAKQFRTREELFPIRIPREPIRLDDLVERALGDDHRSFDPSSIRTRTLLRLEWDDGSLWEAWVVMLPSQLRLFCDSGAEETRVLASGGRNAGDETDRQFLMLLSESAGETFGIEMAGGAPTRVRSSIADRAFLVDVFVNLFEVRAMESEIRRDLDERGMEPAADALQEASPAGTDFRVDVERWLELVGR
ncbi:MAG TPA: hypothetical protein VIZ32_11340 [Vicinamibacterales bacterium]